MRLKRRLKMKRVFTGDFFLTVQQNTVKNPWDPLNKITSTSQIIQYLISDSQLILELLTRQVKFKEIQSHYSVNSIHKVWRKKTVCYVAFLPQEFPDGQRPLWEFSHNFFPARKLLLQPPFFSFGSWLTI